MPNLVEDMGAGNFRETVTNAQVTESAKARTQQVGPWLQTDIAASQAAAAMLLAGSAANNTLLAMQAGTIIGIGVRSNATVTAGAATFQPSKNGTAAGGTAVLDTTNTTKKVTLFTDAQKVSFAAGDLLSIVSSSNSGLLPTGSADIQAFLMIKWDAKD
jgi:hypothetical protein